MNCQESDMKENLVIVRSKIEKAAFRAGRNPGDIKIIAVTKTIKPDRMNKVLEHGIMDLGENRVQELCEKYDNIKEGYNWHLIGHLQTNKVKYIINKVNMIHSVDRIELAGEIQRRAQKAGRVMDVLIQVNIAEEESKFGISSNQAMNLIKEISCFENLKVRGLMTIAPYAQNPEDVRCVFSELRKLLIDIGKENIDNINMDCLSMGMSNDYEVAVEEGSNLVRIGTAIFGKRPNPVGSL